MSADFVFKELCSLCFTSFLYFVVVTIVIFISFSSCRLPSFCCYWPTPVWIQHVHHYLQLFYIQSWRIFCLLITIVFSSKLSLQLFLLEIFFVLQPLTKSHKNFLRIQFLLPKGQTTSLNLLRYQFVLLYLLLSLTTFACPFPLIDPFPCPKSIPVVSWNKARPAAGRFLQEYLSFVFLKFSILSDIQNDPAKWVPVLQRSKVKYPLKTAVAHLFPSSTKVDPPVLRTVHNG